MKSILAVVADGNAGPVLTAALSVGRSFQSHIVGLHAVTTEYAVVFGGEMGFSISSEVDRTLEREGQERRDQARRVFRDIMGAHDVPIGAPVQERGPTAEWREEEGRQNAVVGALGRVFDLIVVEQPAKLASLPEATLEDALFESGRPVLMTPPRNPATIGRKVVVAWNGSTETARTVAFAMPFLAKAEDVQVVSVEGGMTPGPSAEDLARSLARHGMPTSWRHVAAKSRMPGEVFLDEAQAAGADLLIKGAYTQSRLRQMIFGGATRHIIMEARIPVLMAH
ncbi:MAG TPA: universal stress protein [Stellaceae bacterium]|nr:universal stress protein [Stellaceae bacterium]